MAKFIVKYLIARLSPDDLITLGSALLSAGSAARQKQMTIQAALNHVRVGVDKLTA